MGIFWGILAIMLGFLWFLPTVVVGAENSDYTMVIGGSLLGDVQFVDKQTPPPGYGYYEHTSTLYPSFLEIYAFGRLGVGVKGLTANSLFPSPIHRYFPMWMRLVNSMLYWLP